MTRRQDIVATLERVFMNEDATASIRLLVEVAFMASSRVLLISTSLRVNREFLSINASSSIAFAQKLLQFPISNANKSLLSHPRPRTINLNIQMRARLETNGKALNVSLLQFFTRLFGSFMGFYVRSGEDVHLDNFCWSSPKKRKTAKQRRKKRTIKSM